MPVVPARKTVLTLITPPIGLPINPPIMRFSQVLLVLRAPRSGRMGLALGREARRLFRQPVGDAGDKGIALGPRHRTAADDVAATHEGVAPPLRINVLVRRPQDQRDR